MSLKIIFSIINRNVFTAFTPQSVANERERYDLIYTILAQTAVC